MSTQLSQAGRPLAITTPLGEDVLGLRSIRVREQLSGAFTIEVDMESDDHDINFDDIVGHPVAVRLDLPGGEPRYWHAFVARFSFVGSTIRYAKYRALLVPWSWMLTRSSNCRIFQELQVPEIVQQVFRDAGANDFELRLSGSYPKLEYCAQYRETDYNFFSRLLEQEGIAYYFKHEEAKGSLVLADEKAAYDPIPGFANLVFRASADSHVGAVYDWTIEHEVFATQFALTDYNPLKPKVSLLRTANVSRGYGSNDRQLFDYPGEYLSPEEAERLSRVRLDEVQSSAEVVRAKTNCLALGAGSLFTLAQHPRAEQNREYLVTEMELMVDAGSFESGGVQSMQSLCAFKAIPSSQTYRPPRISAKPIIRGMQPALVVGPAGEEIYTDVHGRVKVSFFWDRLSNADEKSSCWLRVAQGWAGKKMGMFFLPRIGQEVLVSFLEGDPDRPLVTGSVYNAANVPPYALPANKNISTLKSESTKGGTGFNEIKLDDSKGKELLYIQAEKDRTVLVKHDNDETVQHDETIEIGNNRTKHVKKNEDVTIDENRTEEVKKNEDITIGVNRTEEVKKNEDITIGENRTEEVGKNEEVKIGENRTHDVGKKDILKVGKELLIDVGDQITIQTGQSSIIMKKDGTIQIKGKDISITGSGKINIKASSDLVLKGSKIAEN